MQHNTCIHVFRDPDGVIAVEYLGKPKLTRFLFFKSWRQTKKSKSFQTSESAARFVKVILDGDLLDQ